MHKILLIIRREYLVRVRTKAFVIFTVLMPLLVGMVVVLPSKLMMQRGGIKHVVIVAADPALANAMKSELSASHASFDEEALPADGKKRSRPPSMSACKPRLRKPCASSSRCRSAMANSTASPGSMPMRSAPARLSTTRATPATSSNPRWSAAPCASRSASASRRTGFSAAAAKTLLGPVALDSVHIDRQGANSSNGLGAVLLPYLLLAAIYATVLIYGTLCHAFGHRGEKFARGGGVAWERDSRCN